MTSKEKRQLHTIVLEAQGLNSSGYLVVYYLTVAGAYVKGRHICMRTLS